jgi:NTE family protein
VALSAVTLNNYALRCGPPAAERLREIIGHGAAAGRARLQFEEISLLEDPIERPHIHLVDGAVSDNLGLRGVIETLSEVEQNAGYRKFLRFDRLRRRVVIIVNSLSEPATDWDRSEAPPGMIWQMLKASTIPIDRYSYEQIRASAGSWSHCWPRGFSAVTLCG